MIEIMIRGEGGTGSTRFAAAEWRAMSAFSRVLALHEALRDITRGQKFDVLRETRT